MSDALAELAGSADVDELIAFLRARLAGDERAARMRLSNAASGERLRKCALEVAELHGSPGPPDDDEMLPADRLWFAAMDAADWLDGMPPARVLREVEAKRRLLDGHRFGGTPGLAAHDECADCYQPWPCPTVRIIASVYADHPNYRQEWS